jgi:phosphoribosylanthranilate isomerase
LPIIVAGGIGKGNLERAFLESGAQVVDLSSSVESSPGVKDFDKLTEVMDGMRAFWEEE